MSSSGPAYALSTEEAQHFLTRTGFGASPSEINRLLPMTREQAVDDLLKGTVTAALTSPPDWIIDPAFEDARVKLMSPADKMAYEKDRQTKCLQLKAWWYREMTTTPSPFTEHMTLFWHNHFTSSLEKVRSPVLMYRQNVLLRHYAVGNFMSFLLAIAQDPAMILYLDTQSNHKAHPNENFARELLELFTLGVGHYDEKDIRESARAFTGWEVDRVTGRFVFRSRQHDDGMKTILGHTGNYQGDDVLGLLFHDPQLSIFITEKLWREFISDKPDLNEIRRLAFIFRDHRYDLQALLRALFLTPAFWDQANIGTLTKSPAEFMVGAIRTFNTPMPETMPLAIAGRSMGQDLFDPPNVKGWPGGEWWITTESLLLRRQFVDRLLRGKEMEYLPKEMMMMPSTGSATSMMMTAPAASSGTQPSPALRGLDLNEWMGASGFHDAKDISEIAKILLPIPPQPGSLPPNADIPRQIQALVYDPAFQLK